MKTEWKLMLGLGIFMLPLGVVYWFTSYEIAGSIMLIVVAIAFAFIGIYLWLQSRRMGGARPEDYDALPSDGAGAVGTFPVSSIWPLIGAIAVTGIGYGLIFSMYLAIPSIFLLVATIIGFAREATVTQLGYEPLDASVSHGTEPEKTFSDQVKK